MTWQSVPAILPQIVGEEPSPRLPLEIIPISSDRIKDRFGWGPEGRRWFFFRFAS
jgi:hypothetical protein